MNTQKTERIHKLVCAIPSGQVASYGQIARYVPGVTARMVGYALAGVGDKTGIPWHRVVNAKGTVSPHQALLSNAKDWKRKASSSMHATNWIGRKHYGPVRTRCYYWIWD
ncbi:hypothetical protein JCM17845_02700 [Iodidimonas gelatinilytica]|uniref:Methylated-DNA-[protein]-cysteine S-methyltransferase DNA binding domain-containing protein n=1 Tax=Iodidimonas gelatinilytica TaxID=1236966 RepID=A0A5A7MUX8_9PROT|nr:MGMT family protein [Iodidimonas gelatinilytica]GEQ99646.1 hypothetical protein JCM17845_02700 [Iodidimonas gelatinilytica]